MNSDRIATSGVHPSVTWDPNRRRWFAVWQSGARIDSSDGLLATLSGNQGSFPRIHTHRSHVWVAYRDGADSGHGTLGRLSAIATILIDPKPLGPIHGAYPCAFGGNRFAFQSGGVVNGWPVKVIDLDTLAASDSPFPGVGVGLAFVNDAGRAITWDELRGGDLHDPTFAGGLIVGATDRDGRPAAVVRASNGDELVLWPGEDSQNPVIATDGAGNFAVVAWSAAGQGIRLATFTRTELKPRTATRREPRVPELPRPLFFGWFFEDGRYGDTDAPSNVAFMSRGLFGSGDNQLPADVDARILKAIADDGGGFIGAGDVALVKPVWSHIFGVWIHEPSTPEIARLAVADARDEVHQAGLAVRPVVAVIGEDQALDTRYARTADILAAEIYFREPAPSWDTMYELCRVRIHRVLAALAPTPVILVPQAYDRSDPAWRNASDQLSAIAQAVIDSLTDPRVLGVWPFAWARTGGALTYSDVARFYSALAAKCVRPPYPVASVPPPAKDKPMTEAEKRAVVQECAARAAYPTPSHIIQGAQDQFRAHLLERDQVAPDLMSGGAFRYFTQHYAPKMAQLQVLNGLPGDDNGWSIYSAQALDAAKKAYDRDQRP